MKQEKLSLRPYYTWGFPLLVLMGLIALGGVVLAVAVHYIF